MNSLAKAELVSECTSKQVRYVSYKDSTKIMRTPQTKPPPMDWPTGLKVNKKNLHGTHS